MTNLIRTNIPGTIAVRQQTIGTFAECVDYTQQYGTTESPTPFISMTVRVFDNDVRQVSRQLWLIEDPAYTFYRDRANAQATHGEAQDLIVTDIQESILNDNPAPPNNGEGITINGEPYVP